MIDISTISGHHFTKSLIIDTFEKLNMTNNINLPTPSDGAWEV